MSLSLRVMLALLFIGALAASFSAAILTYGYWRGQGPLVAPRNVVIPPGASAYAIAGLLEEEGAIRHKLLFSAVVRAGSLASGMQAGEYRFEARASPAEILKKLREGDTFRRSVTVPEGLTTAEALEILRAEEHLSGEISAVLREGDLLPETYDYYKGESREALALRMKAMMERTLDALWRERGASAPVATKEEALVLASVVEKETGRPEERPLVAGVFANRLKAGMRLQSDPTTAYALTKGRRRLDRPLSRKDLAVEDPYNTYMAAGLPPGPICNPGVSSLHAALHPAETDALYFVSDGAGGHSFAATLAEHNRNVAKLRARERKRAEGAGR
jgi:UPF0755 protein